jgi:hypothetical protein
MTNPVRLVEVRDPQPGPRAEAGKEVEDRWLDGSEEKALQT